ncbi:MAG: aminoacyl-tRNA hydrolase [Actinobacteria bacterium]|nr:aminoacyl-tRNA hydrolase [Actinomycetota bacterium]
MLLIVGLGNPGKKYIGTRHNLGFMVIEKLSEICNLPLSRVAHKSIFGKGKVFGRDVIFAQPQTFMNLSGQSVAAIMRYYKVAIDDLLVVHDDLDLPFGVLRFKKSGGSGGHNGLNSIIEYLGSKEFKRLKIGIGNSGKQDPAVFVLKPFTKTQQKEIPFILSSAADAVIKYIEDGLAEAMNEHNREQKSEVRSQKSE